VREVDLVVGEARSRLRISDDGVVHGNVIVPDAHRWWPHTHGTPTRFPVHIDVDGCAVDFGATGFRSLEVDRTGGAFTVRVNGVQVFCRGAAWMPLDVISLNPSRDALRAA
jgi:beta-mannosidase